MLRYLGHARPGIGPVEAPAGAGRPRPLSRRLARLRRLPRESLRLLRAAAAAVAGAAGALWTRLPVGTLLSLLLAAAVNLVILRTLVLPRDAPPDPATLPAARSARLPANVAPPAQPPPARPITPSNYPFADLAGAAGGLGREVWQPARLPPGITLLSAAWYGREPNHPETPGLLWATYGADGALVLSLVQGRGVWIARDFAPADRQGVVTLRNGSEVAWVRGDLLEVAGDGPNMWTAHWAGNDLRVGSAAPGDWGWVLGSAALPLETLLELAAALELRDAAPAPAAAGLTYYLVNTREEAELIERGITEASAVREMLGAPAARERIQVIPSAEEEAAVMRALGDLDELRVGMGLPRIQVVDLRRR